MKNTEKNIDKQEIYFYIPFSGFYCSVYDDIINSVLESEINEGYLTENQVYNIDYSNLHLQMSEHIFDAIIASLSISYPYII